jgi:hypothetical protein
LLGSYSSERSAVGAQVLANASRLTAIGVMKNHTAQLIRNLAAGVLFGLAPVRRTMADTMTEISIGYPDSPLNGPSVHGLGAPAPGERAPPIAGQVPVGSGSSPRFALFAAPAPAASELLQNYPKLLESTIRPPFASGRIWLVRPDGYMACVARDGNAGGLADYLRDIGTFK